MEANHPDREDKKRRLPFFGIFILLFAVLGTSLLYNYHLIQTVQSQKVEIDELALQVTDLQTKEADTQPQYTLDYQNLYPQMYVPFNGFEEVKAQKTVYLTFDDGPSNQTQKILDLLDTYGVKATFFVVGKQDDTSKAMLREIVKRGHSLGVHSYSHQYKNIYASVDAYMADFYQLYSYITEETGVTPTIFRFPGGSINGYNASFYQQIIAEMLRRGFVYYDWDVDSKDATTKATTQTIVHNVLSQCTNKTHPIILMHDFNNTGKTLNALPTIIESLLKQGYTFEKLDNNIQPVIFAYTQQN